MAENEQGNQSDCVSVLHCLQHWSLLPFHYSYALIKHCRYWSVMFRCMKHCMSCIIFLPGTTPSTEDGSHSKSLPIGIFYSEVYSKEKIQLRVHATP